MRIIATLLTVALATLMVSCGRSGFPAIKHPEQLRKDCARLYQDFPINTNRLQPGNALAKYIAQFEIPKTSWPASIVALKPRSVYRDYFGVRLVIKVNQGRSSENWSSKGYYLQFHPIERAARDPKGNPVGVCFLRNSKYDGIDEFTQPSIVK